jgi:hypothetical protein
MLCSQLTYVVGEVLRFSSIDVLEPLWGELEARLLHAGNMDEVTKIRVGLCWQAEQQQQQHVSADVNGVVAGMEARLLHAGNMDEVGLLAILWAAAAAGAYSRKH